MSRGGTRVRGDDRAVTALVGTVLVMGLSLSVVTTVVVLGAPGIADLQRTATGGMAEVTMGHVAGAGASVGRGHTESRSVRLPRLGDGGYEVREDVGRLRITHRNASGNGSTEVLYDQSLGAVVYTDEESAVAYQGGGVWHSSRDRAVVRSPPTFDYRASTLSVSVVRLRGDDQVGAGTARLARNGSTNRVFPNGTTAGPDGSGAPYDESGAPYRNPIENGTVAITVESPYYEGWAAVFRERTGSPVSVDAANETATVRLSAAGTNGPFEMPVEGDSVRLRGLAAGHPVDELSLTLYPDDADSASFSNLKWSLYAGDDPERFELHLRSADTAACGDSVNATVYYADGSGTYHGWYDDSAYRIECGDFDGDGDDEARLPVNFTGTNRMNYTDLSSSQLLAFNPDGDLAAPGTLDEHEDTVASEPTTVVAGDRMAVGTLTNHYLALLGPDVNLTVADNGGGGGASSSVSEDASSGVVEYTTDSALSYLHVTETTVDVELEE